MKLLNECAGAVRQGVSTQVASATLATLASLASQYAFGVSGFADTAPGAPVLYRGVTITGSPAAVRQALAMVRAQASPYRPARAALAGPGTLEIEFGAPSPLGLLTQEIQ